MNKISKIFMSIILMIAVVVMGQTSFASTTSTSRWFSTYNNGNGRPSGYYYVNTEDNYDMPIIKIQEVNSNGVVTDDFSSKIKSVYCFKAGAGFGSGSTATKTNYTQEFNLLDGRTNLISNNAGYKSVFLSSDADYNSAIYLLEIFADVDDESSIETMLAKYNMSYADFDVYTGKINKSTTKADIIETVQQSALWYFTNPEGNAYHPVYDADNDQEPTLKYGNGSTASMKSLASYSSDADYSPAEELLMKMIDDAKAHSSVDATSYANIKNVQASFDTSAASSTYAGGYFYVGPYKFTYNEGVTYTANVSAANYEIVNANGTAYNGKTLAEKLASANGKEFYIRVPVTADLSSVSINIDAKQSVKTVTALTVEANALTANQPIVIIENKDLSKNYKDTIEIKLPEFDLALRKFITSINGVAVATRVPTVTGSEITSLSEKRATFDNGTTAEKDHTKAALEVKPGDVVRYTIRIYNEGEVDGTATKVADYLPDGLTFKTDSNINKAYGWVANGNTITTNYLANKTIKAATSSNLSYEDVEIECAVTADYTETKQSFKNVAEILESSNVLGIELKDRDSTEDNVWTKISSGSSTSQSGSTSGSSSSQGGSASGSSSSQSGSTSGSSSSQGGSTSGSSTSQSGSTSGSSTSQSGSTTGSSTAGYNVSTSEQGKGYEDDDDYEEVYMKEKATKVFDLALRKFVVKVNNKEITDREPAITIAYLKALAEGKASLDNGTTTEKHHTKSALKISTGDTIVYTIRIYNEGNVDGYATEIVDYLPEGLTLTENSEINKKYGWVANGKEVTTTYLKNTEIKGFDSENYKLSYADVQIECTVTAAASVKGTNLRNVAEITKSYNEEGLKDRDSTGDNITDEQRDNYNPGTSEKGKGYEDDDDYEDLFVGRFDLALRKFITAVNNEAVTSRIPQVDASNFGKEVNGKVVTTCTYNHSKEPIKVENNDVVVYTLRVYNEGNVTGYASLVKDDIPEGLVYLPENSLNKENRWVMLDANGNETTDVSKAVSIVTDKLSKEQGTVKNGVNSNLIAAFDSNSMTSPDYRDVKVAFKVAQPTTSDRIIINSAQISKEEDEDGNTPKDDDSTPDEWNEGEDDQDIEKVYVKYFDLALRKWVTHAIVIENGVQKEMATGHSANDDPETVVKVELNRYRLNNTVVKFRYSIRVINEGEIAGYATEITDYIPDGLRFNQADNPLWKDLGDGRVTTDQLKDKLLQPGESADITITLTWINSEKNMGVKTNIAEISKDDNPSDTPDIDSTPNNKKTGEDDIDDAPVALVTMTGGDKTYAAVAAAALAIVAGGVLLIKRYVI